MDVERCRPIHRARPEELLTADDREEHDRTHAVLPIRSTVFLRTHLLALLSSPRRYLATLAFALSRANAGLRGRRGVFYFAEAILVWRAARSRGVRHLHAVRADVASDVALLVTHYAGAGVELELRRARSGRLRQLRSESRRREGHRCSVRDRDQRLRPEPGHDRRAREVLGKDIHVVRCGVDPESFPAPDAQPGSDPSHIVWVARLEQRKGQALLVEAFAELHRRGLAGRLTLVETGPSRGRLEQQARHHGVADRVTFAGAGRPGSYPGHLPRRRRVLSTFDGRGGSHRTYGGDGPRGSRLWRHRSWASPSS